MSLNLKPGIGERGDRVFLFPISSRGDFGAGVLVAGRVTIDATRYRAKSAKLIAESQTSVGTLSGVIQFYDVTDGDVQLLSEVVDSDQPEVFELDLNLDFTQPRVIEVRAGLDIGPTYAIGEQLIVWFSRVELTTVF